MYRTPGRALHAYIIAFNPDTHPLSDLWLLLAMWPQEGSYPFFNFFQLKMQ